MPMPVQCSTTEPGTKWSTAPQEAAVSRAEPAGQQRTAVQQPLLGADLPVPPVAERLPAGVVDGPVQMRQAGAPQSSSS
nr:hypothetical protein [Streptomyces aidingensis]